MRAYAARRSPDGEAEPGNGGCFACGAHGKPFPRPDLGNWGMMLNQGFSHFRSAGGRMGFYGVCPRVVRF